MLGNYNLYPITHGQPILPGCGIIEKDFTVIIGSTFRRRLDESS
jgi:hypothetical protein